ncbi:MAG: hypothetical protein V1659_00445 [Candidatus Woesearchaeota archaeon]
MAAKQTKANDFPRKRKFVAIEIDGLPYTVLKYAMKKGFAGFLKRLIHREDYNLTYYNCSFPRETTVCQADILYGDSTFIPGYRWIDKKNRKYYTGKKTAGHFALEKYAFKRRRGILEGGSSYANMFSGHAKKTIFTIASLNRTSIPRKIASRKFLSFLFPSFASSFRIWFYSITEFFLEFFTALIRKIVSVFTGRYTVFSLETPFMRLVIDGIVRELETVEAIDDLKHGVPRIYLTFSGYDEIAHYSGGPYSLSALRSLKMILDCVKKIYKKLPPDYDFYILSDHGISPAIPFDVMSEIKIKELIEKSVKGESIVMDFEEKDENKIRNIGRKGVEFWKLITSPVETLARFFISIFNNQDSKIRWNDKKQIFFKAFNNIGYIYFNYRAGQINISELDRRYPKLIKNIISHPAIGFIIGKDNETTQIIGRGGRIVIDKNGSYKIIGTNVVARFGKTDKIVSEINSLMSKKNVGDLVLHGECIKGKSVSFENQLGCHGGFGGEQELPIFISKQQFPELKHSKDSKAIYEIFIQYLMDEERRG